MGDTVITVHNLSVCDQAEQPVRLGVPVTGEARAARVIDAAGREVPCQITPLAAGSTRRCAWVALDFLASVKVGGAAAYRLQWTAGAQPRASLTVTEDSDFVTVATGPAKFLIAKTRLIGVEGAWLGDERVLESGPSTSLGMSGPFVVDMRGRRFTGADAGDVAYQVEAGSLRATVTVSGWPGSDAGKFTCAELRFTAYAGAPYLDISYTMTLAEPPGANLPDLRYELPPIVAEPYSDGLSFLRYRLSRRAWREIVDWGWRLPLSTGGRCCTLGGYGEVTPPANLVQYVDDQYIVHRGLDSDAEDEIARGSQAPGWADVRGERAGAMVVARDFWQSFPQRLLVAEGAVEVGLWPNAVPPFSAPIGVAITREMRLVLHGGDIDCDAEAAAFNSPLVASLASQTYCAAGVLGAEPIPASPDSGCPAGEAKLAAAADFAVRLRAERRMYGMLDYGDIGYTNNQRDALQDFVVQFARTGNPALLVFAGPLARHYADVDLRHHHSDPRLVGGGILPDKEDYQAYTSPHTALCVSPSWSYPQGLANFALIAGDARLLKLATGLGRYLVSAMNADGGYHVDARLEAQQWLADGGAALAGLCAVYELAGDDVYREAAAKCAAHLARTQNADGSWYTYTPGRLDVLAGFDRTDDAGRVNIFSDKGGVAQSIVLAGLAAYHRLSADGDARAALLRGVAFMVGQCRAQAGDGFLDSTWPGNPVRYAQTNLAWYRNEPAYSMECNARMLEVLAYAHDVTGEVAYMEEAARVYRRLLAEGPVQVGSVFPWQKALDKVDAGPAKHYPAFFGALKRLGWPEPGGECIRPDGAPTP